MDKKNRYISKCCKAPVTVEGINTRWYECSVCRKATDVWDTKDKYPDYRLEDDMRDDKLKHEFRKGELE